MKKKKSKFLSENFQFFVGKFSVNLNRTVFVMDWNIFADCSFHAHFLNIF